MCSKTIINWFIKVITFCGLILDWNPPSPWTPWHRWWRWTYPCRKLLLGSDLVAGRPVHQLCTFRKKFLVNFCGSEWCSTSWCILYPVKFKLQCALCMNSINLCKELVLPLIFVETLGTSSLSLPLEKLSIPFPRWLLVVEEAMLRVDQAGRTSGDQMGQGGSRRTRVDQPSFSLPETSSRPLTQPSRQACSSQVLVMLVQILRWQCCLQPSSLLVKTTRRVTIREYQHLAPAPRSQLDNWQWSTDSNTILANCKLSLSCQRSKMSFVFHGANSETSLFPLFKIPKFSVFSPFHRTDTSVCVRSMTLCNSDCTVATSPHHLTIIDPSLAFASLVMPLIASNNGQYSFNPRMT